MGPVVTTTSGRVSGIATSTGHAYLGIPYAAPPFGPHRLGPPAAPAAWDGVRTAVEYGATAPQPERGFTIIPEPVIAGDDCLNVNVFTPDPGSAALPVLVWIHGGGFTAGGNSSPWYRGEAFNRDGVVVVSINYRLGAEGFLAVDGAPDNRGVLDMVAALEWVFENVAAFGGDPDEVTIAGQSAGGVACATLMAVPRARGLFRRAVLMSGAGQYDESPDRAVGFAGGVASALGVPRTRDALVAVDPQRLVEAQGGSGSADIVRFRFGPFIDGDVVTASPLSVARAGVGPHVDAVMAGATAEETNALVMLSTPDMTAEHLQGRLRKSGLTPAAAAAYRAIHPGHTPAQIAAQFATDLAFRVPAADMVDALVEGGTPAYAYEFAWRSPVLGGAIHCVDVPYAFDCLAAPGVADVLGHGTPQALADEVHGAWVRFINSGDPGWQPAKGGDRPTMCFDTESTIVDDPLRATQHALRTP